MSTSPVSQADKVNLYMTDDRSTSDDHDACAILLQPGGIWRNAAASAESGDTCQAQLIGQMIRSVGLSIKPAQEHQRQTYPAHNQTTARL